MSPPIKLPAKPTINNFPLAAVNKYPGPNKFLKLQLEQNHLIVSS